MPELTLESLAARVEELEQKLARLEAGGDRGADAPPPELGRPQVGGLAEKLRARLAAEGKLGVANYESLLGAGENLWASDEDFEAFLEHVRRTRAEGR